MNSMNQYNVSIGTPSGENAKARICECGFLWSPHHASNTCVPLFNYKMEARNSWDVNDDSKVIPCYVSQELNRLDS